MTTDTQRAIDAVWRTESPKITASLTRMVRDVGVAEEVALMEIQASRTAHEGLARARQCCCSTRIARGGTRC